MQKTANIHTQSQASNNASQQGMTRRELLIGIMASVGAVTTAGCVDNVEKDLTKTIDKKPDSISTDLRFYSQNDYLLISQLAGLIIPDSDTPGALAVGVPAMMDTLYAEWASSESKSKHNKAIAEVSEALNSIAGQEFLSASKELQLLSLSQLDEQAFSQNTAWGYRTIKSLIARFYYFSEVGATQELRYELVPGRWEACIPFEKVGRTWAA